MFHPARASAYVFHGYHFLPFPGPGHPLCGPALACATSGLVLLTRSHTPGSLPVDLQVLSPSQKHFQIERKGLPLSQHRVRGWHATLCGAQAPGPHCPRPPSPLLLACAHSHPEQPQPLMCTPVWLPTGALWGWSLWPLAHLSSYRFRRAGAGPCIGSARAAARALWLSPSSHGQDRPALSFCQVMRLGSWPLRRPYSAGRLSQRGETLQILIICRPHVLFCAVLML